MGTASLLKANSLLFYKRRQNFYSNLCFIKPARLRTKSASFTAGANARFLKLESFMNSTSTSSSKPNPFERTFFEIFKLLKNPAANLLERTIFEIFKLLKIPVVLMVQSLLLVLMMNGRRNLALACVVTPATSTSTVHGYCTRNDRNYAANVRGYCRWNDGNYNANVVKTEVTPVESAQFTLMILTFCLTVGAFILYLETKISVIKLQVAFSTLGRSYQWELNQAFKAADTSCLNGPADILQKITRNLSQDLLCWIAGYSSAKVCNSIQDAEEYLKQLSIEEQEKFDEEPDYLQNFHGSAISKTVDDFIRSYTVVTILVVAKGRGVPFFPTFAVNNNRSIINRDILDAVERLQTICNSGQIQALNVFCTPQRGDHVMSIKELRENYPFLTMLNTHQNA